MLRWTALRPVNRPTKLTATSPEGHRLASTRLRPAFFGYGDRSAPCLPSSLRTPGACDRALPRECAAVVELADTAPRQGVGRPPRIDSALDNSQVSRTLTGCRGSRPRTEPALGISRGPLPLAAARQFPLTVHR